MPQMSQVLRERVIGMLTAGMSTRGSRHFREFGSTYKNKYISVASIILVSVYIYICVYVFFLCVLASIPIVTLYLLLKNKKVNLRQNHNGLCLVMIL